jgi:hypothetical protein
VNEAVPLRLAMWSGPRNISTAMMRAWGNRPDTAVVDEPFYAYYLRETGAPHPGAHEIIAKGETDWRRVVQQLLGPVPENRRVFYQKHMTHHLLAEVDRSWILRLTNCFLIRDPAEVIASYTKKNHEPKLEDIGFMQQGELFDFVRRESGTTPPVIDARDVLENPERTLRTLCEAVGVEFTDAILSWPAGLRRTDGIWAKHWYAEVERSTGFQPYVKRHTAIPDRLRSIDDRCREIYNRLHTLRLH